MDPLCRVARRFPLVPRSRPACGPLDQRMHELVDATSRTGAGSLDQAAAAHNQAALIASDCGLAELARALCWRQFEVYARAWPLTHREARFALEPLVNLARLLVRAGEGERAHRLLDDLYLAVRSGTDTVIDGRRLRFGGLTISDEDRRPVSRWLWTVLLADGTRALVSAGQWARALDRAGRLGGVGLRLLDGRQLAIVAPCIAGNWRDAMEALRAGSPSAPWERVVAGCLEVLCLRTGRQPDREAVAAMGERYLALRSDPSHTVFHGRLGLAVIDLAGDVDPAGRDRVTDAVVRLAVAAGDGCLARDVLAHDVCGARLTRIDERRLAAAVESSGIGRGAIPRHLMADLLALVERSEVATSRQLVRSGRMVS